MTKISYTNFHLARMRYLEAHPHGSFYMWIGDRPKRDWWDNYYVLNEKQTRAIKMLLSPHWKALLKASIINNMQDEDESLKTRACRSAKE